MDWTYRIRLRNLEMLRSLAERRNISRSAAALNTTQPALSKWLKDLEVDIGLPLFERHGRGLRPTRYGEALVEHARRIVAHLDAARDDLAAMRNDGSGRIVIGTSGASVGSTAPLAVLDLIKRYPDLAVELVEGSMGRLLERLNIGELDVAVGRMMPEAETASLGLRSEMLYDEPVAFIARPDHPLFSLAEVQWDDLVAYRWIVWPKGTPIRDSLDTTLHKVGREVPPLSLESSTVTLNLTVMNKSDLVCLASYRDAQRYADWAIARVVPFSIGGHAAVSMYWRDDGDNRPILAATLKSLRSAALSDLGER